MDNTESAPLSADEQPKQAVAKQVVSQKRRYFFPQHSMSVLAEDAAEAEKKVKSLLNEAKTVVKRKRAPRAAAAPEADTTPEAPTSTDTPEATPPAENQSVAEPSDVKAGDEL